MGSLAQLNPRGFISIPRPLCARPGDIFECVVFNEDIPITMLAGCMVIILIDGQILDGLYVLDTDCGYTLARIFIQPDFLTASLVSLHETFPSQTCKLSDIKIVGRVVEVYPIGQDALRWILYEDGLEFHPPYQIPVLMPKFGR